MPITNDVIIRMTEGDFESMPELLDSTFLKIYETNIFEEDEQLIEQFFEALTHCVHIEKIELDLLPFDSFIISKLVHLLSCWAPKIKKISICLNVGTNQQEELYLDEDEDDWQIAFKHNFNNQIARISSLVTCFTQMNDFSLDIYAADEGMDVDDAFSSATMKLLNAIPSKSQLSSLNINLCQLFLEKEEEAPAFSSALMDIIRKCDALSTFSVKGTHLNPAFFS